MTIGELLNKLASKIGLQNDPTFMDLLAIAELAQHDVDDNLAARFDTGLMSLEGAKNNREVLNHLKPIILKAADDKFAILAEKYGISEEMSAEQSTYKKIDLLETKLASELADLKKKAMGGSHGEENAKLTKQILDLQKQLQTITATKDAEIAEIRKAHEQEQLDMLINSELNGKRYANQDLGDTNVEIARSLITKALKEQNALLINENGVLKLKQSENPSLDFVDSGYQPVAFSDFANRILADKHLLEVSPDPSTGGKRPPITPSTIKLPNGKELDTSSIDAAAAASMADLE